MVVNLPCLWGSYPNFLRPTCPYTECCLSFQTGSRPTERTTVSYSSCFYGSLPALPPVALFSFSGRFATWIPAGLDMDMAPYEAASLSGFCSQSPVRPPIPPEARQDSGVSFLLFTAHPVLRGCHSRLSLHPPDIIQHPGRVVSRPIP